MVVLNKIKLIDLQPSQFYLSQEKIEGINSWFRSDIFDDFSPLPVKILNGKVVLTDGHTRAWVAYRNGFEKVPLTWDEDELDWEAYQLCVDECQRQGINSIADLNNRILSPEEYTLKWDHWCD